MKKLLSSILGLDTTDFMYSFLPKQSTYNKYKYTKYGRYIEIVNQQQQQTADMLCVRNGK